MPQSTTQIFKTTCSYCGVGCGIEILKHPDGRMDLRGDAQHPANRGLLCSKGRSLLHTVNARDTRLHYPTLRANRTEPRDRVTWDAALEHIAAQFQRIITDHGPDAVAFYISGQCLTEEYYLANKIVKGFLGTNNLDTNSRLCMSSAVAGYKATLGADGPPTCYDDIDHCDTFLIAGANPAWCHPVLFRRIEARKAADPNVKIIVIDPRRTPSAEIADLHLQIKPGTDVALFLGLARRLVHTRQTDEAFLKNHVDGAEEYLQSLEPWTLAHTAEVTGLEPHYIAQAAEWLAGDRRFLSMWTMGLNQSAVGTDKNIALISLSLLTGKIGKPGCGPFSLTGQPNAMGGREVGGMSNLLPAHRDLSNPKHRAEVARFWGVNKIPEKPGLTAVELFTALAEKKVKAVWIIATNPIVSMPAAWQAEKSLANAEFVVVQDIYPTETSAFADVILPAAAWLEKTGTMTNAERRISILEKAIDPPGEALADAEILQRFANKMGWQKHFNYPTVADIFHEHTQLTTNTDIDITGLTHDILKSQGPVQWPYQKALRQKGTEALSENAPAPLVPQCLSALVPSRLYTDHHFPTPTGRAKLRALTFEDRSEQPTPELPLILTTGRVRDHWHTMTKTGKVNRLRSHIDTPYCEIHPEDATPRHIKTNDIVTITNPRGEVRVRATLTENIRPGTIFLPMHFGKKLTGRANNITSPRIDPISKEPDLKLAAVQLARFIPQKRRIVIIGAGSAALAFIEQHRQFNPHDELILLGGESFPVYNRIMLPHYIDGTAPWETLIRADRDSLNPHRVIFHPNTLISRIDRTTKSVTDSRGRAFSYDTLILATGSRPAIHYDGPMPGAGIFTLRSRRDADDILAASGPGKHAVIHGGGLLGVELADALRSRGCQVTILQRSDRLLAKQLDPTASQHLAEELKLRNIEILFHTTLVELTGKQKLETARVTTNPLSASVPQCLSASIPADLFIFATGTIPNKELAGAAGLNCEKGILTNEHLQTSDPSIFAIGECAQHGDYLAGTTAGANAQAKALAEFLRGHDHVPFNPVPTGNILKIRDFQLAAAGITDPPAEDPSFESITLHDPRRRLFQKCIIQNDRLVGTICMGDTSAFPQYLDWIQTGLELEDLRNTLLRPGTASIPVDGKLICSCNQVGAGTIEKAAAGCAGDLQRVCAATRAGTGCGSCRPEVAAILAKIKPLPAPRPVVVV